MEGTADVPHPIADVHLPEAASVFDAVTALDTALDMIDPQPTLGEVLVRHVRLPPALLPQIEINSRVPGHSASVACAIQSCPWGPFPRGGRFAWPDQYRWCARCASLDSSPCGSMWSLALTSLWLIKAAPHRGGSISLMPYRAACPRPPARRVSGCSAVEPWYGIPAPRYCASSRITALATA